MYDEGSDELREEIERLREALRAATAVVAFVRRTGHDEKSGTELGQLVKAYLDAVQKSDASSGFVM